MATLYKTDGSKEVIKPADGKKFQIEELQKLVGGYVERVKLPFDQRLIVDEDAKLKGKPMNQSASLVLHRAMGGETVPIAGDAVVGTKQEFGLG
jgi:hypothetical protein